MILQRLRRHREHDYGHSYYFLLRQSVWLILGVAGMFALMRMDYRKLREPIVVLWRALARRVHARWCLFLDKFTRHAIAGFVSVLSAFSHRKSPSSP